MTDPPPGPLLVTGFGRSGTTLLQRLLDAQPELAVADQPFPSLFIEAKRRYLAGLGIERANPLGPRFRSPEGSLSDLATFLEGDVVSDQRLDQLVADFDSTGAPELAGLAELRERVAPGRFFEVYDQLLACCAEFLGAAPQAWSGSKEIVFEELAAVLLERGGAAVLVIRDPRDVVTSFRYGRAETYVGRQRPTLFLLRQWRKSVAFALQLHQRARCAVVRFEDLVTDPGYVVDETRHRLGLARRGDRGPAATLVEPTGSRWRGNSSFDDLIGVSERPVGRWRQHLDSPTVRLIETVCGPEMNCLGYERGELPVSKRNDAVDSFEEPFAVDHPRFMTIAPWRELADEEISRLDMLDHAGPSNDLVEWFVFADVYSQLRTSFRPELAGGPP